MTSPPWTPHELTRYFLGGFGGGTGLASQSYSQNAKVIHKGLTFSRNVVSCINERGKENQKVVGLNERASVNSESNVKRVSGSS